MFSVTDTSGIISPALVVFREPLERNLRTMVEMAGGPERLRPHCKTHKMREVVLRQVELGIVRHKCATFAEAEMLADSGVSDILLAYNLVGPNIARAVAFRRAFPAVTFSVTVDHTGPLQQLGQAMAAAEQQIEVLLDVDTGQHRTGLAVGAEALQLYQQMACTEGILPGGLHVYDGQNHQTDLAERRAAVDTIWQSVTDFRQSLLDAQLTVPRVVAGGSGSFPLYAEKQLPGLELSPGTTVFFDAGYGATFPDLADRFTPAARLLTRVISRPTPDTLTCDLGYKACASDPPAGRRLVFPDLPDAKEVLQNEEHLVLATSRAGQFEPGDVLWAVPRHICPTTALHKSVYLIEDGVHTQSWDVVARDRQLTI